MTTKVEIISTVYDTTDPSKGITLYLGMATYAMVTLSIIVGCISPAAGTGVLIGAAILGSMTIASKCMQ